MAIKITIPDEHYIGMRSRKGTLPLAFITPNGDDKAALNRINTVDRWTRGKDALDSTVIKNVPLYGFKLTCDIRRAGNFGSGDRWYIEDPRGFELEISSANLSYLLKNCVIENGTILDACIWARQSGNNVLLSTSTELYKTAIGFTKLSQISESIKNVKPGNTIILQNGIRGIYLGKYHLLQSSWRNREVFTWNKPQYLIAEFDDKNNVKQLHTTTLPKVSSILDKTEIDIKEAEEQVNEIITSKKKLIKTWQPMLAASSKKPAKISINFNKENNINDVFNNNKDNYYIVELNSGHVGLYNSLNDFEMYLIDTSQISDGKLSYIQSKHQSYSFYENIIKSFRLQNVKNVYTVEMIIKTKLGNEIKTYL